MKRTAPLRALLAVSAAALAIAACNREVADPALTESVDPTFAEYAPPVGELPPGQPVPIGTYDPDEGYAWAEQAHYLNYAFEDDRPDYAYRYDDYDLWAWEAENGWYRIAEPLASGDRFYYYRAGQDWPFYVVDDGYGYGFDDGRLVVAYDPAGRLMPASFLAQRADWGGRYLRRGEALYDARTRAERRAITEAAWTRRQARIAAEQTRFEQVALDQPAWRAWRRSPQGVDSTARLAFEAERLRRIERRARRTGDVRAARTADRAERAIERALPDAPPPVGVERPRRDDNPGVAKRSPRANEVHARNEARKAARDEIKDEKRRARDERKRDREEEREVRKRERELEREAERN